MGEVVPRLVKDATMAYALMLLRENDNNYHDWNYFKGRFEAFCESLSAILGMEYRMVTRDIERNAGQTILDRCQAQGAGEG